jgi:metacaspase-1
MNRALVVGIDLYATQSLLEGCVNDATDLARVLRSRAVEVVTLVDANATKRAIIAELAALVESLGPGDVGYVHFSGHGVRMRSRRDTMDEVLCPHDFAWTRDTAISDRELIAILQAIDFEAQLFVTIDASHSGDFLRGAGMRGRPRTLTPPEGVNLRGPTERGLRALAQYPNIAVVAACSAWETAADADFDGRANGAFTYWLVTALRETEGATLTEIVDAISVPLRDYAMTPVAENADVVYLGEGAYASPLRQLLPLPEDIVFEQRWEASLLDQPFEIDLVMMASETDLYAFVVAGQFGGTMTSSPIRITGNARVPIELGFFGVQIVITISEWDPDGIDFILQVDLESNLAFVPKACIARESVHIDLDVAERVESPSASLVDLLAERAFSHLPQMQPSPSPAPPSTSPTGPSAPRAYRRRSENP